jgi:NAD(P)-dependent dehydrogenase (short-subunit alcohol dehydrogenase family)
MSFVFLKNTDNLLGKKLVDFFSQDEKNAVLISEGNDLKLKLQDENVFVFNTQFLNESALLTEDYGAKLSDNLNKIFEMTNTICKALIESGKKGKIIFVTVNPSLGNTIDFPTAPINDEAIHSFVKTLAKELTPFGIIVNAICLDPVFEMLDKSILKIFRRKMRVYAIQKSPTKLVEILDAFKYVLANDSHLFSGKIYYLGEGM